MKKEKLLIVDGHAMVFRGLCSNPDLFNSNYIDTIDNVGFIIRII